MGASILLREISLITSIITNLTRPATKLAATHCCEEKKQIEDRIAAAEADQWEILKLAGKAGQIVSTPSRECTRRKVSHFGRKSTYGETMKFKKILLGFYIFQGFLKIICVTYSGKALTGMPSLIDDGVD